MAILFGALPTDALDWRGPLPKIDGGKRIEEPLAPVLAIVHWDPASGGLEFLCSGVQVDPAWILTAAHGVSEATVGQLFVIPSEALSEGTPSAQSARFVEAILLPMRSIEVPGAADYAFLRVAENAASGHYPTLRSDRCGELGTLYGWSSSSGAVEATAVELEVHHPAQGEERLILKAADPVSVKMSEGNSGAPIFAQAETTEAGRGPPPLIGILSAGLRDQADHSFQHYLMTPVTQFEQDLAFLRKGTVPGGYIIRGLAGGQRSPLTQWSVATEENLHWELVLAERNAGKAWLEIRPTGPNRAQLQIRQDEAELLTYEIAPSGAHYPRPELKAAKALIPLHGAGSWIARLGEAHLEEGRLRMYARHLLLPGGAEETISVSLSLPEPTATAMQMEASLWEAEAQRLIGRCDIPGRLQAESAKGPFILRIEALPGRAASGEVTGNAACLPLTVHITVQGADRER